VRFTRRHGGAVAAGLAPASAELAECARLLAGFVRVGVETEATTLALEADLDDHVSTTKGCYTGQEIVARIHTYGHTNRKACLLWLGAGAPITAAQELQDDDEIAVGRVLHAVPVPGHAARLGLGYLPKDFQGLGTKLRLAGGGGVEVIGYEPLG
jgi:folate-binding protein YgfZ